jgi:hypothetical protein
MPLPKPLLLSAAVTAAATLAAPVAAQAAPLELGDDGRTVLRLDSRTAQTLRSLSVRVSPLSPARPSATGIAFPISGGTLDTATAAGRVDHGGGLRLRAGRTTVDLRSFRVSIGRSASLSALVGGRRVTILSLGTGDAAIGLKGASLTGGGVTASLNATGARALNQAFGVRAFRSGLRLGTVRIEAAPRTVVDVTGGTTDLALEPATAQALVGAGIHPFPLAPATASGTTFSFPIKPESEVASTLATGTIAHGGGIALTKDQTTVNLTAFDIRLDATPSLFANVNGSGQFAEVVDLDLSNPTVTPGQGSITVGGVVARLSAAGAQAVNAAFGTNLPAGTPLGTATFRAQL